MGRKMKARRILAIVITAALTTAATLFFFTATGASYASPAAPEATPDLYIDEFTMTPASPQLHEPVTFTIRACNADGGEEVAGRRIYLYIDPADRPPLSTTRETTPWVVAVAWPPGDCQEMEYANYTFGQSGQHVAYAWVDPLERIDEGNEANNLAELQIDVEPEIPPGDQDVYEPDDACDQAQEIPTDGTAQTHKFDPQGDEDWVKFQATAGQVYTITAAGSGEEAHPVFELWDSCSVPPGSFGGTTFRLVWSAPADGTYYLKLNNDLSAYKPAQSAYQLTVQTEEAVTGLQPYVNGISPAEGANDQNTYVVITGTNFSPPPRIALCPFDKLRTGSFDGAACGDCSHVLENASWPDSQTIYAVTPANLPQGDYCVAVTNPGGKMGTLADAFSVLPGQPDLREAYPTQGYNDLPADLSVYGFNFHTGISVTLGGLGLGNVSVVNQTALRATVPAGLAPGSYTMTAFYGGGETGTLPNAYTVLAVDDDLFAQEGELWVDPLSPRAGATTYLGLLVHRQSVTATLPTLSEVPVRFSADGQVLGTVNVPLLSPDGEENTRRLEWVPSSAGEYEIEAVIDPDDQIAEVSEANNTVTRTVSVLGQAEDEQSPHVDSLLIKDSTAATEGQDTVTDTLIYLAVEATDYPQPGAEGVSHLRYVEFEYSQGAQLWVPVQDSGWVVSDTVNADNYRWQLTPVGGVHYIQAWAKDAAGNISHYPYQQRVNYLPPSEWVGRDQRRVYRRTLAVGETLQATLTPLSGDADLYVWPPDWAEGRPPWVSNLSGDEVEDLSITAPVSGVYQVEVYGYAAAEYQLEVAVGAQARAYALRSPARVLGKAWLTAPAVAGEPPTGYTPPQEVQHFYVYLPLVLR